MILRRKTISLPPGYPARVYAGVLGKIVAEQIGAQVLAAMEAQAFACEEGRLLADELSVSE